MDEILKNAYVAGAERVSAWSDLLDAINVFPVADGDTGRNLAISLTPLRQADDKRDVLTRKLLLAARGNSGNIASQYFSAFTQAQSLHDLAAAAQEGNVRAWKAIADPKPGTMLTVFDALEDVLWREPFTYDEAGAGRVLDRLKQAVAETHDLLPKLREAGVVDAGALGMYIFFEGFFRTLAGAADGYRPVTDIFKGRLQIDPAFQRQAESGYCVDFVIQANASASKDLANIVSAQESAVVIGDGNLYKIHLHTDDRDKIKSRLAALGTVVNWEDDNLSLQMKVFAEEAGVPGLHIMTDAAGSLTRDDAKRWGFTLLNSYLNVGEKSLPETCFHPEELYRAMRGGRKVSTSQSSVFERHEYYAAALARFEKVLYLCVGSVFTGNYQVACDWKKTHDPEDRLIVMDTGAASGRLGIMVLAAVRFLAESRDVEKTLAFVRKAVATAEEYVFLEKLEYLAAGGRLSKTSAFFGDMLKMKPVISPQPEGAKKVGVVRNRRDQIKMAMEKLQSGLSKDSRALVMLEYSDNNDEVREIRDRVAGLYPKAEIVLQPLSLTSGAHMGPGTWGLAFLNLDQAMDESG